MDSNKENFEVMRPLPKYKCYKEVWALKIKALKSVGALGDCMITPEEKEYAPFKVSSEYMLKHKPEVGGYYVQYSDGYKSYSPAKAFEEGYNLIVQREMKAGDVNMIVGKVSEPEKECTQDILIRNGKHESLEIYQMGFQDKRGNGQWFQISKELYFALLNNNIKN